ncbi:MAG: amidase, partial [Pyrinomonadaceae bacterium]
TPWNTEYWSGGSSSGPGAATAAGLLSFSIGSETSGSIITPAAYCGVSGLRPTYGAVSRHGAMALCWTLDKLGPLCHSVEDCDLVFSVIAGYDAADPTSRMRPRLATSRDGSQRNRRKKLAVMKDSYEKAQPEVRDNFLRSVTALKEFADVEMDVGLPDFPYGASVGTIVGAEGAAAFREQIETGQMRSLASPEGRVGGYTASLITAVDYLHAMRLRGPMRRAWAEMFRKFDLLIAPSRSTVAYPINQTFDQAYPDIRGAASPIAACNLVGVPAVSVPNGLGPNNLPTGIQFVGPAWGEEVIFEVVGNYQKRTDWHKAKPAVA